MALIDTYRNNVLRKRNELAKLSADKAKESGKIAAIKQRIQSAQRSLKSSKSSSTINSKLGEISRYDKQLADIDKKIATIEKNIATKTKELGAEEKKLSNEEMRINKKQAEVASQRYNESQKQYREMSSALAYQHNEQQGIKRKLADLAFLPEKITVLFLASNPKNTDSLRLDEEAREIREMISKSKHRDAVKFETRLAVRPLDILQAINELNPDVIHFSGHGTQNDEIVLEDADGAAKLVSKEGIVQTIRLSSERIKLVFFNICFSSEQAQDVVKHIEAAIGMTTSIGDKAAIVFSSSFYSALGFGLSLEKSFSQAKAALLLEGIPEENTPAIYIKDGLNSEDIFIVKPPQI